MTTDGVRRAAAARRRSTWRRGQTALGHRPAGLPRGAAHGQRAWSSGTLNVCPTIDGISANPAEVQRRRHHRPRRRRRTTATPARSALAYAWTASGRHAQQRQHARTRPSPATPPGTATVTVTVSDGDPAASAPATLTAQVNCTVAAKTPGTYVAGDFHNHTTCSDGSISMQKLIKKATDKVETPWGLDWFVQAGHGGNGNRNCRWSRTRRLATPPIRSSRAVGPNTTWENSGVTPQGRRLGHQPEPQHVALAVDPGVPVPADRVPQRAQEPAAVHRHRDRSSPATSTPRCRSSPVRSRRRSTRRRCRRPERTPLPAARPTPRSATPTRSRSGSTASTAATPTPAAAPRNNWDCSVPGSAERGRSELERHRAEADPRRRHRHRHQGPRQDARSAEVDGRLPPERPATTCPPTSSAPASSTRTATTASTSSTCATSTTPRREIAFGMETQPGHGASANRGEYQVAAQQHRRRPDRQRRRHDLRRHRRLRRAGRRRVGRAAGRRPQLLVLRQLRLAQPRQLRSRRPPHDAGLLPRRVPAQLHAGAQRQRQAAAADDRRRPAHRQQLRDRRPDHRSPRLRGLRRQGRRASSREMAANGAINKTAHQRRRAAPRWARS